MRTVIICLAMTLLSFGKVQAQNDPVLTGMIYAYTDKAEKEPEEPGKGDADADHRAYLDERGSGRNHQPATRVQ